MKEKINNILKKIETEVKMSLKNISAKKSNCFVEHIIKSKRIFVTGAGRSGYVAEGFAMRLMQSGFKAYHIGDATTPSISKDDLLIAISGSGKTDTTNIYIKKAKQENAKTILITNKKNTKEKEKLKNIDLIIEINAKDKHTQNNKSIQPLASLFEQSSLLYLDAIIVLLMEKKHIKEKNIKKKHSNLE